MPNILWKNRVFSRFVSVMTFPFRHWRIPAIMVILCVIVYTIADQILLRKLVAQRESIRSSGGAAEFSDFKFPELDSSENAAIWYRYAAAKLERDGKSDIDELCSRYVDSARSAQSLQEETQGGGSSGPPLTEEESSLVGSFMARNEQVYAILRDAQDLQGCYFLGCEKEGPSVKRLVPDLNMMESLSRYVVAKATWQFRHNDIDGAYEWITVGLHLCNQIVTAPCLLSELTREACAQGVLSTLQKLMCDGELPEHLPDGMLRELDTLADRSLVARAYEGEMCFGGELLKKYEGMVSRLARPLISVNWIACNDLSTLMARTIREESFARRRSLAEPVIRMAEAVDDGKLPPIWRHPRDILAILQAPACARSLGTLDAGIAQANGARLTMALKQYRRAHGTYPDSLSAVVPDYLSELPEDPFSGEDFRYRREGDGFVVYSVSMNGLDDNGARAIGYETGDIVWCSTN